MGCGGVVRRVQEPSRTFASCTSDVPLSLVRGRVAASVSLDLECVVVLLVGVRMVASCPLPCSCVFHVVVAAGIRSVWVRLG
jgi:hypothetical protein